MTVFLYSISLLLAALMGFAVHRAGLCMVKTVAEMLSTRKAFMMATVLKAVLWDGNSFVCGGQGRNPVPGCNCFLQGIIASRQEL